MKTLDGVKADLDAVKGKTIKISVSRGRGKTEKISGKITDIYPNVFVSSAADGSPLTYSVTDLICGNVKILGNLGEKTT